MAALPADTRAIPRRMVDLLAISAEEQRFAELVYLGVPRVEAAERAGLTDSPSALLKRPAVRAALRDAYTCSLEGQLVPISTKTLKDVLEKPEYSGAAKVAAVKLVWSAAGILPTGRQLSPRAPEPGLEQPAGADIQPIGANPESGLRQMQAMLADMHRRLTAAAPIDVTPEPAASSPIDL